jgi:hypothetical protein
MRGRILAGVVGSLLLAFDPALGVPATTPLGALSSQGTVEVNGVPAPNGLNVYVGNRIVTAPGAVAVVMLARGGKLALGGATSASLTSLEEALVVKLDRGVVDAVSEMKAPVLVQVGRVTIRAGNGNGAFEVVVSGRSLRVIARRGPVLAEDANRTVLINAGKTMKTSVAPATATSGGGMGTVMIVAGATAAAGLGVAIHSLSGTSAKNCVSPSRLACP